MLYGNSEKISELDMMRVIAVLLNTIDECVKAYTDLYYSEGGNKTYAEVREELIEDIAIREIIEENEKDLSGIVSYNFKKAVNKK